MLFEEHGGAPPPYCHCEGQWVTHNKINKKKSWPTKPQWPSLCQDFGLKKRTKKTKRRIGTNWPRQPCFKPRTLPKRTGPLTKETFTSVSDWKNTVGRTWWIENNGIIFPHCSLTSTVHCCYFSPLSRLPWCNIHSRQTRVGPSGNMNIPVSVTALFQPRRMTEPHLHHFAAQKMQWVLADLHLPFLLRLYWLYGSVSVKSALWYCYPPGNYITYPSVRRETSWTQKCLGRGYVFLGGYFLHKKIKYMKSTKSLHSLVYLSLFMSLSNKYCDLSDTTLSKWVLLRVSRKLLQIFRSSY